MVFVVVRVYKNLTLGILETRLYVYEFGVVNGIYIRQTGCFENDPMCLCLCFCIGYVHI